MKASIFAVFALATSFAEGAQYGHMTRRTVRIRDNSGGKDAPKSSVPAYNFTMPVDHFDASNKRTYPNRYFVNDTYYKAGGPVIVYDNGEAGFDPDGVSSMLAETDGKSLPMQLAANLSGIVIGWEHRYYGYSRPVKLDDETGFPVEGINGYKYLSVEQALADVAFFANNFNKTTLGLNAKVKSGNGLDPYNTPWIFIGASYPGARAAWMRQKYPEIIYASWASSAPLEYQPDGFPYFNPIMRSMPKNCTSDLQAAVKYMDNILGSGSKDDLKFVKAAVYLTGRDSSIDDLAKANTSIFDTAGNLASTFSVADGFQNYGPRNTTQAVCDYMEAFDLDAYLKDVKKATGTRDRAAAILGNPGSKKASAGGIAAANGDKGGEYAFAALVYGISYANEVYSNFTDSISTGKGSGSGNFTANVDNASWNWQTISQTGIFQGSNPNNITCVSKFYNFTAVRDIGYVEESFGDFDAKSIPAQINNKGLLDMGGWGMKASNVMFTNGEFDPWRSFSVASEESDGPHRKIVQKVPACNTAPPAEEAFGLTYLGAVHGEDVAESSYSGATYVNGQSPLKQGMGLFLEAWKVWQPCFNTSRDSVRAGLGNAGGGNGPKSKSGASPKLTVSTTVSVLAGIIAAAVL